MNNLNLYRNGRRFGAFLGWTPMRLFDDLMSWEPPGSEVVWSAFPSPVHLAHTEDGATATVDMPGVEPSDLELTFERGTLLVAGKRGEQVYRYRVMLGDTIDPDSIEAKLDKGVLTVHARTRAEAKPRRILVATPERALGTGETK
ncbi:MAG: Hsp20/alpha crystallin family protein [Kofleriaceae bacterium]